MNKIEIKRLAKQVAETYYDTYCGTGFVMCGSGLVKDITEKCIGGCEEHELMACVMEGILEGIAKAELLHRQGMPHVASPLQKIEERIAEHLAMESRVGVAYDPL